MKEYEVEVSDDAYVMIELSVIIMTGAQGAERTCEVVVYPAAAEGVCMSRLVICI